MKFIGSQSMLGDLDMNNNDINNRDNDPSGGGGGGLAPVNRETIGSNKTLIQTDNPVQIITATGPGIHVYLPDDLTLDTFFVIINAGSSPFDVNAVIENDPDVNLAQGDVLWCWFNTIGGLDSIGGWDTLKQAGGVYTVLTSETGGMEA